MSDTEFGVDTFTFATWSFRYLMLDGQPWFVAADLCDALGLGNVTRALAGTPDKDRGQAPLTSNQGSTNRTLMTNIVNEPGLWRLIFRSRKPEAEKLKTFVFEEVLPALREHGYYTVREPEPQPQFVLPGTYAEALRELADTCEELAEAKEKIEILAFPASAWQQIVDATGEYTVASAAQLLDNLDGITMGQNRLFAFLREQQWVKPAMGSKNPRPYQRAITNGWLTLRPVAPHQRDGVLHASAPQILITSKGLNALARMLTDPLGNVRAITTGEPLTRIELAERFS